MSRTTIIRGCTLEIDTERGVIYVHGTKAEQGLTLLRICQLPTPITNPAKTGMLDIAHGFGVSWSDKRIRQVPEGVATPEEWETPIPETK